MRGIEPSVSVVLPTYNRAESLAASIASVLEQSLDDLELIVVDDGSTDATKDVVAAFKDDRIRYIGYETNRGAAHARNVGLEAARSDLVAFQDSDDEWLPGKLAKQVEAILGSGLGVGVVYTDMLQIGTQGKESVWRSPDIVRGRLASSFQGNLDYQVLFVGIGSALVRKGYIEEAGGFDENLRRLEDLDLLVRLSFLCDFIHIREPLVRYDFVSSSSNLYSEYLARAALLEKYRSRFPLTRPFIATQYNQMGRCLSGSGRPGKAIAYFWKAFINNPGNIVFFGEAITSLCGSRCYNAARRIHLRINPRLHSNGPAISEDM